MPWELRAVLCLCEMYAVQLFELWCCVWQLCIEWGIAIFLHWLLLSCAAWVKLVCKLTLQGWEVGNNGCVPHVVLPFISQRCQITATGVTSDTYNQDFVQREEGGNPPKFFLNLNFPAGTLCAPAGKCYVSSFPPYEKILYETLTVLVSVARLILCLTSNK